MQPASPPSPPQAVSLPSGRGVLWESAVKVGHRLERSLPRWTWKKTRDLCAVTFDNDFLALYGQTVKHLSQIACQLRCGYSLHQRTSLRNI